MSFNAIITGYAHDAEIGTLVKAIMAGENPSVEGIPATAFPLVIAALSLRLNRRMLVITRNNIDLYEFATAYREYLPGQSIITLPGLDILPYEYMDPVESIACDRIGALHAITNGSAAVTVATVESLMRRVPSAASLSERSISIAPGDTHDFESLCRELSLAGYAREARVEQPGCFSVKGGIVDVFPSTADAPCRIEFFGDTVESLRSFDPETQKSTGTVEQLLILPRNEMVFSPEERELLAGELRKAIVAGKHIPEETARELESGMVPERFPGALDYFPRVRDSSTVIDFFDEQTVIISIDYAELSRTAESTLTLYRSIYAQKRDQGWCLAPEELLTDTIGPLAQRTVNFQTLTAHAGALRPDIKAIQSHAGRLAAVREDFSRHIDAGWKITIATSFEGQARRIRDLFREFEPGIEEDGETERAVSICLSSLSSGLLLGSVKHAIFTDQDIFGKSYRKKRAFRGKRSRAIDSFAELSPGDAVVHINHGIGVFQRIERMEAGGIERDYIVIEYAGGDLLFVSLDQLGMVQKYTGLDGKEPRVDSLGKKSAWNRIRQKVQETVDEIAEELIALYARRKAHKGITFPPDTQWQEEFEARFEYEETPDQISAIEDVKDDMESPQPMDRLVCGDVGFGKTEVAIRAAFKAAMAGKQTAILVPTTILALQHFKTFKRRFEGYPVEIEMISRFREAADIRRAKSRLSNGEIDIIIGTHALLSEDVFIKNLGLLIIDEEQRFGVKHKERLKKFRSQVDVLTLSATPIPRTMHMALAGIRGLSVIETPPVNRHAIETFVLEDNPDIVKMAVERELARAGQVFYIHNRVNDMETHVEYLQSLVPDARIAHAHGQMDEVELENIMIDFMEHRYDILVSTTIIESGVDMPRVNTIIVNRADSFGLSQLYQLKGRVGRSDRQAYAYFFFPRHIVPNETAMKRLTVISEFSELGSGYRVAMKDMEIRGAGNILGREQSGCIVDVGFDLYVSMLEEAVRRLRGEKPLRTFRTPVFLGINTFIPDSFVSDVKQKIELYKRMEAAETPEELDALETEIADRFGELPTEVTTLMELQRIRALASALWIEEIMETERTVRIRLSAESRLDIHRVMEHMSKDKRYRIDPRDALVIVFNPETEDSEKKLHEVKKWLQQMS